MHHAGHDGDLLTSGGPHGLIHHSGHEGDLLPTGGPGGVIHHARHEGDLLLVGRQGVLVQWGLPGGGVPEVVPLGLRLESGLVYTLQYEGYRTG